MLALAESGSFETVLVYGYFHKGLEEQAMSFIYLFIYLFIYFLFYFPTVQQGGQVILTCIHCNYSFFPTLSSVAT